MKRRALVPVIPVVASLALAAPALAAGTAGVSENWAGYEVTPNSGTGFSAASGEWTQPAIRCAAGQSTYSAFWVGLGGGGQNSNALEQQGTQADCGATGKASYYAWYELVPSAPVKIDMKVSPGDQIYSRTAVSGNQVTVEVDNKTTGQDFVKTLTMTKATPDTSTAEWVAEAPSQCSSSTLSNCTVLPLSDFGAVKFTNASATSNSHTGSISDAQWTATPITLSGASSGVLGGDGGYLGTGYSGGYGTTGSNQYGSGYPGGYSYLYGNGYPEALLYSPLYYAPESVSTLNSGSSTAAPGSLSSDGTSFTVTYGASTSGSADTTGSGAASSSSYGSGDPYSSAYPPADGYYPGDGYPSISSYGDSGYAYAPGGLGTWYYVY